MKNFLKAFFLVSVMARLAASWLISPMAIAAEATNAPSGSSLGEFKIITERNIFNANRRPGSTRKVEVREEKPPKIEAFSLVGTMHDEEAHSAFAFFDGTEPHYCAVLKPGETIGGHKLLEIVPDSVKLGTTNDTQIDLPMGMQMRRQAEGSWQLIVGTAASSSSSASREPSLSSEGSARRDRRSLSDSRRERGSSSSSGGIGAAARPDAGSANAGSTDDILRRLMEKREQELKK